MERIGVLAPSSSVLMWRVAMSSTPNQTVQSDNHGRSLPQDVVSKQFDVNAVLGEKLVLSTAMSASQ